MKLFFNKSLIFVHLHIPTEINKWASISVIEFSFNVIYYPPVHV